MKISDRPYFFGLKHENPTCAPQIRPIGNFFGIIKQEIYQNNWKAENRFHLEGKIRREITKIQQNQKFFKVAQNILTSKRKLLMQKSMDFKM